MKRNYGVSNSLNTETAIAKEFQGHTSIILLHNKIVIHCKLNTHKILIVMMYSTSIHTINDISSIIYSNDLKVHEFPLKMSKAFIIVHS